MEKRRQPSKRACRCPPCWIQRKREKQEGGNGWRSRERYRRDEEAKRRDTLGDAKGKRGRNRNGSAGLSRTSFIFSPRLNIKDNLIIGGFSHTKAGRAFPRSSLCPSFHLLLSSFSGLPLHFICRRPESLRSATQENSYVRTYRYTPSCLQILM